MRILRKSLMNRKGKVTIAILAVVMGTVIPSAMMSVSLDISEKVNYEFRKYGANLLVVPESETIDVGIGDLNLGMVTEQRYINETDIYKIKTISWQKNVLGYAPLLYQIIEAEVEGQVHRVVLTGTWFQKDTVLEDGNLFKTGLKNINPWWEVQGNWINDSNELGDSSNLLNQTIECMIGTTVAKKLGLGIGDEFNIKYQPQDEEADETACNFKVVTIITTGSSEDNHIFVNLSVAQSLTGGSNKVHAVQVSALCFDCPVETIAGEIEASISNSEVKTIIAATNAEMNVLHKVEQMMILVTLLALFASVLGVSATMTTSVIERQDQIGLMKSIGAENKKIAALFLTEATIIGFLGGVLGYLAGIMVAQFIGLSVFSSTITPRLLEVFPIVVGISIVMSLVASSLPVRRAMKIEPIIVLRGD